MIYRRKLWVMMNHPSPKKNVFFTGFMATGKTRIGEATARSLGWQFVDTDRYIESEQGRSISEIFEKEGEAYFRDLEFKAIQTLTRKEFHIISLGGGALTQSRVMKLIKAEGILVRLWAPVEVISERIGRKNTRPLMQGLNDEERRNKVAAMLAAREPYYSHADISIESREDTSVELLVRQLRSKIAAWNYKAVEVKTSQGNYPIFIGENFLDLTQAILRGLNLHTDYLIVTDTNVARAQRHNLKKLTKQANGARNFRFPAGEEYKNVQTLNRLYTYMLRKGYSRKTTLIQFSGGVTGDMAGYGAASYQRGIPFIQVPTTLLSMVDSSVGGKVAVNHALGKNMIGAFYQPKAVLINLEVLETLEPSEYLAGLAEVVKYGIIWDEEFFKLLEDNVEPLKNRDLGILKTVVTKCCKIKAEVVSQDETEQGIRAILNYGHTFGHAIEKLTEYKVYSHGTAVSLGMRVAGQLAQNLGLWTAAENTRQTRLLDALGFPKTHKVDINAAWEAMGIDKKVDQGKRVYILPTKIGHVKKVQDTPTTQIEIAWKAIDSE